nr:MAG TPA: hypothetical protein [Caudoviricetes sp.]
MRGYDGAVELALRLPPGSHTATALGAGATIDELQADYLQLLLQAVSALGGGKFKPTLLTAEPEESPLVKALDGPARLDMEDF